MTVAWTSPSSDPVKVEYRALGEGSWRSSVMSSVDSYTIVNNSWYSDDYKSPFIHHVSLTGLMGETIYQYKVVATLVDDAVRTFTSGLSAGTYPKSGKPFVVSVVGDLGQTVRSGVLRAARYCA
jgi:hypothetical protein